MFVTPAAHTVAGAPRKDALFRVLSTCLDIVSVWSIDHEPHEVSATLEHRRLLAFGDARTLIRLRASEHLHDSDVDFLVVTDGNSFASAWGPSRLSGSLARWAWRQASRHQAYYDESRWAADANAVIRVRRKAFLVWDAARPALCTSLSG